MFRINSIYLQRGRPVPFLRMDCRAMQRGVKAPVKCGGVSSGLAILPRVQPAKMWIY